MRGIVFFVFAVCVTLSTEQADGLTHPGQERAPQPLFVRPPGIDKIQSHLQVKKLRRLITTRAAGQDQAWQLLQKIFDSQKRHARPPLVLDR